MCILILMDCTYLDSSSCKSMNFLLYLIAIWLFKYRNKYSFMQFIIVIIYLILKKKKNYFKREKVFDAKVANYVATIFCVTIEIVKRFITVLHFNIPVKVCSNSATICNHYELLIGCIINFLAVKIFWWQFFFLIY